MFHFGRFCIRLAADFRYFVLNLPARNGTNVNYRVNFNTCASLATDPDMCVGTEYFDDGGSSNAQGTMSHTASFWTASLEQT